jgi:hypothetical protein
MMSSTATSFSPGRLAMCADSLRFSSKVISRSGARSPKLPGGKLSYKVQIRRSKEKLE